MVNGRHLVQSEADIAQDLAMVSGNFSYDFTIFTLRMYIATEMVTLFGVNCNFEHYLVIFSL